VDWDKYIRSLYELKKQLCKTIPKLKEVVKARAARIEKEIDYYYWPYTPSYYDYETDEFVDTPFLQALADPDSGKVYAHHYLREINKISDVYVVVVSKDVSDETITELTTRGNIKTDHIFKAFNDEDMQRAFAKQHKIKTLPSKSQILQTYFSLLKK